jgi:hypothetical protein
MSAIKQVLVAGAFSLIVACADNKASSFLAPSPRSVSPPSVGTQPVNPNSLVVCSDTRGFFTTDLLDAHERIVQLTNGGDLIWTTDGTHLPGYEIDKHAAPPAYFIGLKSGVCRDFCAFSVRFGARDGQRHAYLTIDYGHSNPGTLVNVEVVNGAFVVTQTSLFPPGTPTLFGTVTETTPTGPAPVAGAWVGSSVPGGWQSGVTDQNGLYRISGLIDGSTEVDVDNEGYQKFSKQVALNGDMRLDIDLVRP